MVNLLFCSIILFFWCGIMLFENIIMFFLFFLIGFSLVRKLDFIIMQLVLLMLIFMLKCFVISVFMCFFILLKRLVINFYWNGFIIVCCWCLYYFDIWQVVGCICLNYVIFQIYFFFDGNIFCCQFWYVEYFFCDVGFGVFGGNIGNSYSEYIVDLYQIFVFQ